MDKPNYTQISNEFIENMNMYSGAEVKIFLAISRKTIGWHKESDRISYSQLRSMTGLSVRRLKDPINKLIKDGWIERTGNEKSGYSYDLYFENTVDNISIDKMSTELETKCLQNSEKLETKCLPQKKHYKIKKKENKIKYRSNVKLKEKEINNLIEKYGESQVDTMLDKLDNYKGSKGKQYKSDYRAILLWVVEAVKAEPIKENDNNYGMCDEEIKFHEEQRRKSEAN